MFDASEFQALLKKADQAFVEEASQRMDLGAEKYGPLKFLEVDTVNEAMAEVLDLANYARMTYIKLYIMQARLQKLLEDDPAVDKEGFVPLSEFHQKK
jgi:hypothetical protein